MGAACCQQNNAPLIVKNLPEQPSQDLSDQSTEAPTNLPEAPLPASIPEAPTGRKCNFIAPADEGAGPALLPASTGIPSQGLFSRHFRTQQGPRRLSSLSRKQTSLGVGRSLTGRYDDEDLGAGPAFAKSFTCPQPKIEDMQGSCDTIRSSFGRCGINQYGGDATQRESMDSYGHDDDDGDDEHMLSGDSVGARDSLGGFGGERR